MLIDMPYHKLEAVLVLGNVQITTQALGELMDKGILVSYLTRQGRFWGSVHPPAARAVIHAKVRNGHDVLRGNGGVEETVHGIREAPDHATLLGL